MTVVYAGSYFELLLFFSFDEIVPLCLDLVCGTNGGPRSIFEGPEQEPEQRNGFRSIFEGPEQKPGQRNGFTEDSLCSDPTRVRSI